MLKLGYIFSIPHARLLSILMSWARKTSTSSIHASLHLVKTTRILKGVTVDFMISTTSISYSFRRRLAIVLQPPLGHSVTLTRAEIGQAPAWSCRHICHFFVKYSGQNSTT